MTEGPIILTVTDGDSVTTELTTPDAYDVTITDGQQLAVAVYERGLPGPAGPDFRYVHDQDIAAATWVIVHSLDGYPNVTTVDTISREFVGEVTYDSLDQLTIRFATPMTGRAFLS